MNSDREQEIQRWVETGAPADANIGLWLDQLWRALVAERALRVQAEQERDAMQDARFEHYETMIATAEARVARLEQALTEIAEADVRPRRVYDVARAALGVAETKQEPPR